MAAPSVWSVPFRNTPSSRLTHYITLTRWLLPSVPHLVDELCRGADRVLGEECASATELGIEAASRLPRDILLSLSDRDESTLELIASMHWVTGERERSEPVDALLMQYCRMPTRYINRILDRYEGEERVNMLVNCGWKYTARAHGLGYQWVAYAALNDRGFLDTDPEVYAARSIGVFGLESPNAEQLQEATAFYKWAAAGLADSERIGMLQHFAYQTREMSLFELADRLAEGRYVDPPDPITMCPQGSDHS